MEFGQPVVASAQGVCVPAEVAETTAKWGFSTSAGMFTGLIIIGTEEDEQTANEEGNEQKVEQETDQDQGIVKNFKNVFKN